MEPTIRERHPAVEGLSEEELQVDEFLDEFEVEDLLGHHVEFDEQDDWPIIES